MTSGVYRVMGTIDRLEIARRIGHLPRFKGQHRIVDALAPVRPDGSHFTGIAALGNGMNVAVDTRSHIEREVYLYGGFERDYAQALEALFREGRIRGPVGVDIGANIGLYSLLMAPHFETVHSFEPQGRVFDRLVRNLEINNIHNVKVHRLAVGTQEGEAAFHSAAEESENHGLAGFSNHVFAGEGRPFVTDTVRVVSLDRYLSSELGRIGFVKIDVEGFELQALAGMDQMVSAARPVFFIEILDDVLRRHGHRAQDIFDWFGARSYEMCDLFSLQRLESPSDTRRDTVLAVPREKLTALRRRDS